MSTLLDFLLSHCDQFKRGRLPSLYSDFTPQRYSNPDGFNANVAAWQQALLTAARAGLLPADGQSTHDTLSLRIEESLLRALETKEWGRPLALATVIVGTRPDESISHHQIIPFQDFINAVKSVHTWGWKVQPWWFLSWSLRQMGVLNPITPAKTLPPGRFIVVSNVDRLGSKLLDEVAMETNQVNRIYPMKTFREKAGNAIGLDGQISESDLTIILTSLSRDRGAVVYDSEVVKFKASGDNAETLSIEDKTIAALKVLIIDLSGQVDRLSKDIKGLTATAREAAGKKDRASALRALKSKKLKESRLAQSTDSLSQVEEVLQRIEQAHDQVAMVKVMKASTSVLQKLRNRTGEIDKVEKIVEDLRDEMQQVDELGKALEAGGHNNVIDEDVIDEELESIMHEAKAKEKNKEAQATQRRLAELDNTADMKEPTQRGPDNVDASIAALKRLSLEEEPARPDHPEVVSGS